MGEEGFVTLTLTLTLAPGQHCTKTTCRTQGFWPGTPVHHFHPNTHECYGVVSGATTMLLGRGQLDPPTSASSGPDPSPGAEYGRLVPLAPGDVIAIPAGTSHMNVEMTEDYRFVGVYPLVRQTLSLSTDLLFRFLAPFPSLVCFRRFRRCIDMLWRRCRGGLYFKKTA